MTKYRIQVGRPYRNKTSNEVVRVNAIRKVYDGTTMVEYANDLGLEVLMPTNVFDESFIECKQVTRWEDVPEHLRLADSAKADDYMGQLKSEQCFMYGNLVEEKQKVAKPKAKKSGVTPPPAAWSDYMEQLTTGQRLAKDEEGAPTQSPSVDPMEALDKFKK